MFYSRFQAVFWQFSGTTVEIWLLGGLLGTCHQFQNFQRFYWIYLPNFKIFSNFKHTLQTSLSSIYGHIFSEIPSLFLLMWPIIINGTFPNLLLFFVYFFAITSKLLIMLFSFTFFCVISMFIWKLF